MNPAIDTHIFAKYGYCRKGRRLTAFFFSSRAQKLKNKNLNSGDNHYLWPSPQRVYKNIILNMAA